MASVSSAIAPLFLKFSSLSALSSSSSDKPWGLRVECSSSSGWGFAGNIPDYRLRFSLDNGYLLRHSRRRVPVRASLESSSSDDGNSNDQPGKLAVYSFRVGRLRETIGTLPSIVGKMKSQISVSVSLGLGILIAFVVIAIREVFVRQYRYNSPGSVADLVRRGHIKSDRRGIARPLKYDDPFDNPLVKISKSTSSVKMCGKIYRLAPVTLTEEQQAIHQKRRLRAYQWKRPTVFLKEGETIPPDVDPDTVRWIPANHPFATTVSDIDESLAQNNVYQKRGVPFRIRAEHEALQKKLEILNNEGKLNQVTVDPSSIRNLERPFESVSAQEASDSTFPGRNDEQLAIFFTH
ncbi:hypothetical protein EJ110_NYTH28833 [Nymphaea thermarum]|nr:hypothetical protein EJ110_NYTH28833 [Nymphaea thermarum]